MKTKGFTLIELLVVLSIISLLSSIILTSLSSTRVKARNSQRNSLVIQYQNALQLWSLSHNNQYPLPDPNVSRSGIPVCLGTYSVSGLYVGGKCGRSGAPYSPSPSSFLANALAPYFPSFPPLDKASFKYTASEDWLGAVYYCGGTVDANGCRVGYIQWYLEGSNQKCGQAQSVDTSSSFVTGCIVQVGF